MRIAARGPDIREQVVVEVDQARSSRRCLTATTNCQAPRVKAATVLPIGAQRSVRIFALGAILEVMAAASRWPELCSKSPMSSLNTDCIAAADSSRFCRAD